MIKLIPTMTLSNVTKLKGDCQKRSGDFYRLAERARGKDDTLARINDTNGSLNTHLVFIYGLIEQILESINTLADTIDKLPKTPDFRVAKKELRKTESKERSTTF
jgi:hypothetical protein